MNATSIPHSIRPRRLGLRIVALGLAIVGIGAACTGERPELVMADGDSNNSVTDDGDDSAADDGTGDDETADDATTTSTTVAFADPTRDQCAAARGPGPWQIVIDGTVPPSVPCVMVGLHHRIDFINNTDDVVSFDLAGLSVNIEPASNFMTDPAGTFLQPEMTVLNAQPHPVSGIWLTDTGDNTLAGQPIGLNSLGPLTVGSDPDAIMAALDRTLLVDDSACYITSVIGDPYSPLMTMVDGELAVIRIFSPGQLTRSDIGVGSSEDEVRTAYGDQIEVLPSPDGNTERSLFVFVPNDEPDRAFRLVFTVEDGSVVSIRNGLTDRVLNTPGCPG